VHFRSTVRPAQHLLVVLDALESLFELGYERGSARGKAVAAHDAPEVIAPSPVRIVDGHDIFGRSACYQDNDVGLGGPLK